MINPSANVFVFGGFNIHRKDWLTYSCGADRPGELYYNFFISNDLIQIVSFPALIHGCCSQSSSSGFISFFWHNYLFYNGVPSIGKSWLCCLSFQCLSVKLKRDVTFYYIAYNYLRADWEGIYDHLWTVPWENIFKPNASVASEFC